MSSFLSVSAVLNEKVADRDGAIVGAVVDVLIDKRESRIAYVTIEVPVGDSNENEQLVIPWSMLSIGRSTSLLLSLAASKSTIQRVLRSEKRADISKGGQAAAKTSPTRRSARPGREAGQSAAAAARQRRPGSAPD